MAVDTAQVGHGPSEIEVLPDSNPFATPFDNIKEPSVDSAPIFDIPPRNPPKINPFKATFNVVLLQDSACSSPSLDPKWWALTGTQDVTSQISLTLA